MDVGEVDDRTEDEIYIDHLFNTYIDHWGRRFVELYMIYTSLAFIPLVPDIYLSGSCGPHCEMQHTRSA